MQIHVVALLCVRNGHILVCRKKGTTKWMQPGGKPLPEESLENALRRELHEELGTAAGPLTRIGTFCCAPANEVGAELLADVFCGDLEGNPVAQAEIEEVAWAPIDALTSRDYAPLIMEHMLPYLGLPASSG